MQFNLLEHPIVFVPLRWLHLSSAWLEHTPFGMLLIELARPKLLVELGTHTGVSYCAFLQAIQMLSLPTKCFAIDTWLGDAHSKGYSATVLTSLQRFHDPNYGSFSRLVQKTFDDAVHDFEDGSIDVLHIDGLHTYEAVKHDFETWRPKLSKSAVVLFHDTAEMKEDFGVHRLWAELLKQYPHFEFKHGHGLGVLGVGENLPPAVAAFLQDATSNPNHFRHAFAAIGARESFRPLLAEIVTLLHSQQVEVNQCKQKRGEPVMAESVNLQLGLADPIGYARYVSHDAVMLLRKLMNEQAKNE